MSIQLYEDLLNLAREQANVDLLVKIWSDSVSLSKKDMIKIKEKIIEYLPYLRHVLGMLPSQSKDFKKFVEEYDEHQYKKQCPGAPKDCLKFFAKKGDLRNVKKAVEKGHYDRIPSITIRTAAKYNQWNIVDYILLETKNSKVSDSVYEKYLSSGLEGASEGGHVDLVNFFLERGAPITSCVLYAAAKNGAPEILNLFHYTKEDKEAGLEGAASGGYLNLVKQFLRDDPSIEEVLEEAIENSAKKGHLPVLKYLLSKDSSFEYDALRKAAFYGQLEVVKYFVEERNLEISQLLPETLETGVLEIFYYLLSIYLESNPRDSNTTRMTRSSAAKMLIKLLNIAARLGHKDVVEYLLSIIDDSTILDSILVSTVQGGRLELLKILLKKEGRTISLKELLLKASSKSVIEFLIMQLDDLNIALIDAVRARNKKVVYYLLEAGANNIEEALSEVRKRDGRKLDMTILSYLLDKQHSLDSYEDSENEYSDD